MTEKARVPGVNRPSTSKQVKRLWHQACHTLTVLPQEDGSVRKVFLRKEDTPNLRAFVRDVLMKGKDVQLGIDWLVNKAINTSKPPLGIGSTRKKKGQQGQQQRKR